MTGPPRHWTRRGIVAWALLPVSLIFLTVSVVRRVLYRAGLLPQTRLRVPVVVVGNLVAGGTGKTPVVIALVAALQAAGRKPGVVSRGFEGTATSPMGVTPATDPAVAGDEPVLIAQRCGCPVWVGRRRAEAAVALIATHPECDVIVCDDGMQHYAIARELEIAVFDERGIGNGWPLPAGPLRESPSRIGGVDFVLFHGTNDSPIAHPRAFSFALAGGEFHALGGGSRVAAASDFAGKRVAAVAGIGNPQRFFTHLSALGIEADCRAFPDHHRFAKEDLDIADADAILMTEKDAVKCSSFALPDCWALRVNAELPPAFIVGVLERLDGRKIA
jgi:tetraacyldisaccharide 4'-kinase